MRVDFIELLRCPAQHEPSALVTVADARDGDRLIAGTLGCPVCLAEYPLQDGVVDLTTRLAAHRPHSTPMVTAPTDAARMAALLNLAEPGLKVALCGAHALSAETLTAMTDAHCLAINAPRSLAAVVSSLCMDIGSALPLASASLHGIAVDVAHVGVLADAARLVRVGGRVVAPVNTAIPQGLRELARDAVEWVAQVEATAGTPIQLARAG